MAEIKTSIGDLRKGLKLKAGEPQTVSIGAGQGTLVEMEDLNFNLDSAVMLPEPRAAGAVPASDQDAITGLSVIATCFLHAEGHPGHRLLITGHADRSGGEKHNLELSDERGRNVRAVMLGEKAEWAGLSDKRHKTEDYQAILKWMSIQFGFPTDPGEVDGKDGDKTKAALKAFQQRYNADFKRNIAVDGKIRLETWEAFFDLYMLGLRDILGEDEKAVEGHRKALRFLDDGKRSVGCGENHPIEAAARDGFRSKTNRRVELLFFEEDEALPRLPCHPSATECRPEKCFIYALGLFGLKHIPAEAAKLPAEGVFAEDIPVKPSESEAADGPDDPETTKDKRGPRDGFLGIDDEESA